MTKHPLEDSLYSLNRRAFLSRYAGAIGTLALSALLEQDRAQGREQLGGEAPQARPETGVTRKARARSVICLFQHGGPSQMDLFDPKPALAKLHGQAYPGKLEIHFDKEAGKLL